MMRPLPLHDQWAAAGAAIGSRLNAEVVTRGPDPKNEYRFIRETVGLTDFSFLRKFMIPEEKGVDFLDSLVAGNVAKIRFGRALHTFLADTNGSVLADCYVANNDEELIVLCECIADDATLTDLLANNGAKEAGCEDVTDQFVALSIDGVKAWAVAKDLFGADILGLPYLSIERYQFENETVRFLRAGKTSEFGYLMMAPRSCAKELFVKISELTVKYGGGLCGVDIHSDLRLEGRFFNIFAEGRTVRDPLSLGLQWMIDWGKEKFVGSEALAVRRRAGLTHKIIGVQSEQNRKDLLPGALIFDDSGKVSEIIASCYSPPLNAFIGLALFPVAIAYSGLTFSIDSVGGSPLKTISMPPIMPKSLQVKLDEM
jgi:glycine cleavage system aminomethyltransferase T